MSCSRPSVALSLLCSSLLAAGCASATDAPEGSASEDIAASACALAVPGITTPLQRGTDGVVYFTPSRIALRRIAVAPSFFDANEDVAGSTSSPYAKRDVVTTDAVGSAAESVDAIAAAVHRTLPGVTVRSLPLTTSSAELRVNVVAGETADTIVQRAADGSLRFVTRTYDATANAISSGIGIAGVTAGVGAAPGCAAPASKLASVGLDLVWPASWVHTNEAEVPGNAFWIVTNGRGFLPVSEHAAHPAPRAAYDAMMKTLEATAPKLFPYAGYDASWSPARVQSTAAPMRSAILDFVKATYAGQGVAVPANLEAHLLAFASSTPSAIPPELVEHESMIADLFQRATKLATFSVAEYTTPIR